MKTSFVLIIMLAFSPAVFSKELKLATFNTYWLYDDKPPHLKWWTNQRGKKGQTYEESLSLIATAIKKTGADIIALQEIESLQVVNDLNKKLADISVEYPYVWISNSTDDITGQNVALLSKYPKAHGTNIEDRYINERETYLTENDQGNESEAELSKALRVDLEFDGKELTVFVFHLKSQRGGSVSDQRRIAQASIVRRLTLPLIQSGKRMIVMGDMNADRGSPTLKRLRGFDDIYADLIQPIHNQNFNGDKWTYKYDGRTQQLDHILLSPSLRETFTSGHIQSDYNRKTSDHLILVLTLNL